MPIPPVAELPTPRLQGGARYLGTTPAGSRSRVTGHGLAARSTSRISLSGEGLDIVRLAGSFRIPAAQLRSARAADSFAGRPVPPHGALVVRWTHGEHTLDTGFRLQLDKHDDKRAQEAHHGWVRSIGKIAKENP